MATAFARPARLGIVPDFVADQRHRKIMQGGHHDASDLPRRARFVIYIENLADEAFCLHVVMLMQRTLQSDIADLLRAVNINHRYIPGTPAQLPQVGWKRFAE